jgi:superfamily II DNA or RNA helicase
VSRIESSLDEFGGALLCDDVGMGKTFVAIAVARAYSRRLVVAPAALAQMWRQALSTTDTVADFVSFERLSRNRMPVGSGYDLLIVDEAHHARSRATRRYSQLQQLARHAKVLLLTATPIHNRRDDMLAVLSLFLGSRASTLTPAELARCIVRRDHEQVKNASLIPEIRPTVTLRVPDDPEVVRGLMTLPEPIPVREGGLARALIGRGLVHQWASSEAALNEALRRRIARACALIASLEAGTYPTEQELRTWIFEDGTLQLGFPELLSAPTGDSSALLESMRRHLEALERFRPLISSRALLDNERADLLLGVRHAHPKAKIVAFAQYTATVATLFRRLARVGRVAMLTAHGARVAGGKLSREEALARFAPRAFHAAPPAPAEAINLLLSTDLLSEGVNLQDAEVVVHLDVPWTAARLDQRVGRVARMGSAHSAVNVYMIRPPSSAAMSIENEILVQRKWDIARQAIGSATGPPFPDASSDKNDVESVTRQTEILRAILAEWDRCVRPHGDLCAAAVSSPQSGFLAGVSVQGRATLIVSLSGRLSTALTAQIAACRLAVGDDARINSVDYEAPLEQIREWWDRDTASAVAGLASSSAPLRRPLVARIDAAIERAPPHLRSRRAVAAARARTVATAPHSAAIERELDSLTRAQLPDDEWLAAVAQLDSELSKRERRRTNKSGLQIHALLLLRSEP